MEHKDDTSNQGSYYKNKKILKGHWKGHEIEYLATEIVIRYKTDMIEQLNDPKNRSQVKNKLINELPPEHKIIKDFDRFGRLIIEITSKEQDLLNLIEQIARSPYVEYAEPNIIHRTGQRIPNEYNNLAALQTAQWALGTIGAPFAWDHTTGSSDILISIVDSGIPMPARSPGTIYRWHNPGNADYLYTIDPTGESVADIGYVYEGAPFKLFAPGTTSTVTFFRWRHPTIGYHFYTTDPSGELAPASGYISEGDIGNIATKKISGTVELYRWYHPTILDHFYTTDPSGELAPADGYNRDGIAGYVLPIP